MHISPYGLQELEVDDSVVEVLPEIKPFQVMLCNFNSSS